MYQIHTDLNNIPQKFLCFQAEPAQSFCCCSLKIGTYIVSSINLYNSILGFLGILYAFYEEGLFYSIFLWVFMFEHLFILIISTSIIIALMKSLPRVAYFCYRLSIIHSLFSTITLFTFVIGLIVNTQLSFDIQTKFGILIMFVIKSLNFVMVFIYYSIACNLTNSNKHLIDGRNPLVVITPYNVSNNSEMNRVSSVTQYTIHPHAHINFGVSQNNNNFNQTEINSHSVNI
jgi:hypothetical protein